MSKRNFYEILNSAPTASFEELRCNYRQLILQSHPDKLQHDNADSITTTTSPNINNDVTNITNDPTLTPTATVDPYDEISIVTSSTDQLSAEFVAINKAWNTLKDPKKRRLYDAELLLTKFQAHSNIFARLKLADMKRCAATTTTSNNGNGSDSDVDGEGEGNTYWYYTYDCRCGGQYIVDESADSEILNRNGKHTQATAPPYSIGNGKDTTVAQEQNTQQKQINDNDNDDDDKNGQAAVGSSKANMTTTNCGGNNSNSETANIDENIVKSAIPASCVDNDDGEEEGEVLVECSECSLVIVLT
ncbi:uncharacterized protein Spec2 isoform X1 [Eurosta solidaginis]|uniref:uncharacterized protein Spec2 isoform X1 n=1 Tax=Eurosta solidaginis TaxID=178769 RepID=UPI0035310889